MLLAGRWSCAARIFFGGEGWLILYLNSTREEGGLCTRPIIEFINFHTVIMSNTRHRTTNDKTYFVEIWVVLYYFNIYFLHTFYLFIYSYGFVCTLNATSLQDRRLLIYKIYMTLISYWKLYNDILKSQNLKYCENNIFVHGLV